MGTFLTLLPVFAALLRSARAEETLASSQHATRENIKAPRLTSIEDIFVDGAVDEDWSNLSWGYTNVTAPAVEALCYDLEPWGSVSFARDFDRIWVGGQTYLEAVMRVQGASDVLVSLEGVADGESVVAGPVRASEILVAANPDDGEALAELLAGDWVDLRVRLKDMLGDVDAEETPLTQIVFSLAEEEVVVVVEEEEEEEEEEGKSEDREDGRIEKTDTAEAESITPRLCVAGVVIVD